MISDRLNLVSQRMQAAAKETGRDVSDIRLIAVSKGKDENSVFEAIAAGQKIFGENRVQEARDKFSSLRLNYPDLELHLIGPLQTNKAEEAVKLFDVIQTLDRPRLAEALAASIRKLGRTPRLYIEVNIGNESQKAGIAADELDGFLNFCRDVCLLRIEGLMCIPPQGQNPEPYFLKLKELAAHYALPHISMGMSGDFEAAIRCGATEVRVGAAIFGERNPAH